MHKRRRISLQHTAHTINQTTCMCGPVNDDALLYTEIESKRLSCEEWLLSPLNKCNRVIICQHNPLKQRAVED